MDVNQHQIERTRMGTLLPVRSTSFVGRSYDHGVDQSFGSNTNVLYVAAIGTFYELLQYAVVLTGFSTASMSVTRIIIHELVNTTNEQMHTV